MYTTVPNPGAGDCLFISVAQGIMLRTGIKVNHRKLRKQTVDYIENKNSLKMLIESPANNYLANMRNHAWGGHIEIAALAKIVQRKYNIKGIKIYHEEDLPKLVPIRGFSPKLDKKRKHLQIRIVLDNVSKASMTLCKYGTHFQLIKKVLTPS